MPDKSGTEPLVAGPADGTLTGDVGLLAILEAAIGDERAAQQKYRSGREQCADPEARSLFEQLLRDEEAHERALSHRYAEVKKRIGLSGAGREA
jgi:bacterioferritin (cytochrome b1)